MRRRPPIDPNPLELGPPTVSEQLLAYVLVSLSAASVGFLLGYLFGHFE